MFVPFLLARCAPHHLVDIALDGLQLPHTLFFLPVIVVPGVLLGGKLLNLGLQGFVGWQLLNAMLPEIPGGCVRYDNVAFVLLAVAAICLRLWTAAQRS